MDSKQLYQEVILDHNKKPRNWGKLAAPAIAAEGLNPLCGDHIWVALKVMTERSRTSPSKARAAPSARRRRR